MIKKLFQRKNQVKVNHKIYFYFIGENGVVIKSPDGGSKLVKGEVIKGHYNPRKFKKIVDKGENWVIKSKEVKKYIEDTYEKI